jgi:pre-mRNA-splicing factor ATP-dependent RNA helicase DHX16
MLLSKNVEFPVEQYEKFILSSVKKFKLLMIIGETGSGKTTIVPRILYKNRIFNKIIVSQTKRIAAINAANYISKTLNLKVGRDVGYAVRFENNSYSDTRVKFVTDGILFKELSENPSFSHYNCVIIDEFHERTIYTDLLLSILKKTLYERENFRLIIMSASGECDKMAKFFDIKAGKLTIPGRLFRIKIFYTITPQSNYVFSISAFIVKHHLKESIPGNFLVFLPGQEEIQKINEQIEYIIGKKISNFIVIKFYSGISEEEYLNIFKILQKKKRKIILATNIAESSITIPEISLVIDSGLSKQKITNWKNGIDLFRIYPISKSEAQQRAGRAGRERIGKCYRMYTFKDFCSLRSYPKPEIQRIDLTSIILMLYSFKQKYFLSLDFITIPPTWSIYRSFEKLFILGIITHKLKITYLGKLCSTFPLEINMSITIIEALKKKNRTLLNLILAAISVLSTNMTIFAKKNNFLSNNYNKLKYSGDQFCYAIVFYKYQLKKKNETAINWCKKKNLNENCLKLATSIKTQIKEICFIIAPLLNTEVIEINKIQLDISAQFRFCFTAGYFLNAARFSIYSKKYQSICSGLLTEIYPFSLYKSMYPKIIIFHEFFITSKPFIRGILPTRLEWLILFGKKIFI